MLLSEIAYNCVNKLSALRILFTPGDLCKVCSSKTVKSAHQNFYKCYFCGSYSNCLPDERYSSDTWYKDISDVIIDRDLTHWKKVGRVVVPELENRKFSKIIDLAGGMGLLSAVLQDSFLCPVTIVDACVIPSNKTRFKASFNIVKNEVMAYLDEGKQKQENCLIVNSHFIEHLEVNGLRVFLTGLKKTFRNSVLLIYCPNGDKALGREKNFIHFNTNLKGEHRIVWSYQALKKHLQEVEGVEIIYSRPFELDQIFICKIP